MTRLLAVLAFLALGACYATLPPCNGEPYPHPCDGKVGGAPDAGRD